MKITRNLNRSLQLASFALAAAFFALPLAGHAQDQEKGATKLMRGQVVATGAQAQQPGDTTVMCCPMCKNSPGVVVDKSLKANVPDTKSPVTVHQCGDCTTKVVARGGKTEAKTVHSCQANASDKGNCCASK